MGEVRIGSGTFRTREIVLGAVVTLAVVLGIVFLGLYASKGDGDKSGATNSGAARQQATTGKSPGKQTTTPAKTTATTTAAKTTTPAPTQTTCTNGICLETTAYVWSLVNTSVDPCEDFYAYACGKWDERNPLEPNEYLTNVPKKLYYKNKKTIRGLIESGKLRNVPWSSERKVKDLYKSCLNDYGRTVAGANPFIEKVINKVGGWFVLGSFEASSWDIMDHLEKIHVDHYTDVLFKVTVMTDYWNDRRGRHITLIPGGTGMYSYYYTSLSSWSNKTRNDYKKFIRTMGSYLVDDSGISITTDERKSRLDTYVSDVIEVETRIANLSRNSPFNYRNTFDYSEKVLVKDLAALTGPPFDWLSFFRYMFGNTVSLRGYTPIAVPSKTFAANLAADIEQLGTDKNRKLNNYMIWRLLFRYRLEMSSKYLHAGRDYLNDRYGVREFPKAWESCFSYVKNLMPDAISRIFIENHFYDQNKAKVTEIAGYVKQALEDGMSSNKTFLDADTKATALDKVQAIVEKYGYPAFMLDKDSVDTVYKDFKVSATDFFSNALSANKLYITELRNEYIGQWLRYWDRTQWQYKPYDSHSAYIWSWNEIEIPAGLLQHPIYDYNLAHYLNFGSVGNIIADRFVDAVDYYGSRYNKYGDTVSNTIGGYTGWWKSPTLVNFNARKSCLADQFVNKTTSYVNPYTQTTVQVKTSRRTAERFAMKMLDDIWGLQTGLKAYQAWVKKNGPEPLPPVIKHSPTQMFFVAYMQTKCYVINGKYSYYRYMYGGGISKNNQYNGVVAQLDEFSKAFKCSPKATLNPKKKCQMS